MTGWQVLGWAGIASLSIMIIGFGVAVAAAFYREMNPRERSTSVLKGSNQ